MIRRASCGVLRFVMGIRCWDVGVVVSGKLRTARAMSMKFIDGFMFQSARDFIDYAVRHVPFLLE